MGQATVDLPDPLKKPDPPRHPSADDLLSQMAGEEIDRLLADAAAEPPQANLVEEASQPVVSRDEPDPFEPQALTAPPMDAAAEALSAEAAVAAQLDDLFKEISEAALDVNAIGPLPTRAVVGEVIPDDPATLVVATSDQAAEAKLVGGALSLLPPIEAGDVEARTAASERAALVESSDTFEAIGHEADALSDTDVLPIYLRPLEWINAPLLACPEAVREAFGKLAILTLFNSLAVLLYVLIFRRH